MSNTQISHIVRGTYLAARVSPNVLLICEKTSLKSVAALEIKQKTRHPLSGCDYADRTHRPVKFQ